MVPVAPVKASVADVTVRSKWYGKPSPVFIPTTVPVTAPPTVPVLPVKRYVPVAAPVIESIQRSSDNVVDAPNGSIAPVPVAVWWNVHPGLSTVPGPENVPLTVWLGIWDAGAAGAVSPTAPSTTAT